MANVCTFWDEFIEFCRMLIQVPSVSGEEKEIAQLIQTKMKALAFDDVWSDDIGNVIGLLKGDRSKPSICFTGHMDTVPVGDETEWECPPLSGRIEDGFLHGRGACDMKVGLAYQVYVPKMVREYNIEHGDIYVIIVVQEEQGGLGSKYLDRELLNKIDYAINGEPTTNKIHTEQKGRLEVVITFKGKSAHPSTPWLGVNPLYRMAQFLTAIEGIKENAKSASAGDTLSVVAPTSIVVKPNTSNSIPALAKLTLDWRNTADQSEAQVLEKIRSLLPENAEARIQEYQLETYTGALLNQRRSKAPFQINRSHRFVKAVAEAVSSALDKDAEFSKWYAATDCGIFMEAGVPIVGFSPGDVKYAHTDRERISIRLMEEAMKCYPAIISYVSRLDKRVG